MYTTMKNIFKSTLLLLCSVAMFSACSDDNDSNPTLAQPTTFKLNTPAYAAMPVHLETSAELPFTWSSPDYGFPVQADFQLEASINGSFTVSIDEADADESGATIPDYVIFPASFTGGNGTINAGKLATAINRLGNWDDNVPENVTLTVRASAITKGAQTIYSNTVNVIVIPTSKAAPAFAEFIYEIGNESGWGKPHALRSPAQDGIYKGFYYLDGEFKFKPNENDWNGDWEYDGDGKIADNGGDNMPGVDAGFYLITVDLNEMTYSTTPITNISIIGGFNDWAGDVEMTYNVDGGYWECTTGDVVGEYKFRANHDWGINWGGTEDNLIQDGANLNSDGGTHTYKLYITYEGACYVEIE
jgi:hypothetical protein